MCQAGEGSINAEHLDALHAFQEKNRQIELTNDFGGAAMRTPIVPPPTPEPES